MNKMNKNILDKLNNKTIKTYPQLIDEIRNEKIRLIKEYETMPILFPSNYNGPHIFSLLYDYETTKISVQAQKNNDKIKLIVKIQDESDQAMKKVFSAATRYRYEINKIIEDMTDTKMIFTNIEGDIEGDNHINIFTLVLVLEIDIVIYDSIKNYYMCKLCHCHIHKNIYDSHICNIRFML